MEKHLSQFEKKSGTITVDCIILFQIQKGSPSPKKTQAPEPPVNIPVSPVIIESPPPPQQPVSPSVVTRISIDDKPASPQQNTANYPNVLPQHTVIRPVDMNSGDSFPPPPTSFTIEQGNRNIAHVERGVLRRVGDINTVNHVDTSHNNTVERKNTTKIDGGVLRHTGNSKDSTLNRQVRLR